MAIAAWVSWLQLRKFDGPAQLGRTVGGEHRLVAYDRIGKAGERHVPAAVQSVEEGFKLGLIRVVRDVAGIEHLHGQAAPGGLVGA